MLKKLKGWAAVLTAAIVMSSAVAASAASSVSVTGFKAGADADSMSSITLANDKASAASAVVDPTMLIEVTGTVEGAAANDEVAFISKNADASAYDNASVQYVDQKPAGNGTVTFTYRPRYEGTFDLKLGATDATASAAKYYTVGVVLTTPVLSDFDANVIEGTDKLVINITKYNAAWQTAAKAYVGDSENMDDTVVIAGDALTGSGTITIPLTADYFTKTLGAKVVTIKAGEGYTDLVINFNIIEDTKDPAAESAAREMAALAIESTLYDADGEIALPAALTTGEAITWSLAGNDYIEIANGTVKYADGAQAPAAVEAVELTAELAGNKPVISKSFVIYLMPAGKTGLSFGNICGTKEEIFSDQNALDAFIDDADNANEIATLRVNALNVVLGRSCYTTLADNGNTLDFDGNDAVTLSEYDIFVRMLQKHPKFTVEAVKAARN